MSDSIAQNLAADLKKEGRYYPNGTIIAWEYISITGISYSYAAVFADGSWYTTLERGNSILQPKVSHKALMRYFAENVWIANIRVATAFEAVESPRGRQD